MLRCYFMISDLKTIKEPQLLSTKLKKKNSLKISLFGLGFRLELVYSLQNEKASTQSSCLPLNILLVDEH